MRWAIDRKFEGSVPAFHKAMKYQTPGYGARLVSISKGNSKPIGDKAAREIEEVLRLEPNVLDTPLPEPRPGIHLATSEEDPLAAQLLSLFSMLSPEGRYTVLVSANTQFIRENPGVSSANPYINMAAAPAHAKAPARAPAKPVKKPTRAR